MPPVAITAANRDLLTAAKRLDPDNGEVARFGFESQRPTRDPDPGFYFILNSISARGAFAPYYQAYLKREEEFLNP